MEYGKRENENCELLFDYLKSILYDTKVQRPDLEKLDEPYRKLGEGLQFLQKSVEELLTYSADLSTGNLSGPYPGRDNFLCVNMKNLHANLNHLTWQAKQVASGDYSQHVSYLGEFSEAFNTMTAQLKNREALLREETAKAEKRAAEIESYNEVLVEMTRKHKACYDPDTGLKNRLFFQEYMDKALKEKTEVTLCYMDLDGLKYTNDRFGHNEGDNYIHSFVSMIREYIHGKDIFARVGGDEFCLILPDQNEESVKKQLAEVLERFKKENDREYPMSFSYGVVELNGTQKEQDLKDVIKLADARMYEFKSRHKEKYRGDWTGSC